MNTAENEIRSIIESWAIWRDAGSWDDLRTTWHDDGRMKTTWFRGSADAFVESAQKGFDSGSLVHHFLGGSDVRVAGSRAIAQTKMSISQRLVLDGAEVDVTCIGRFYDFFERRDSGWRIVLREPIYEKDRMDAVVFGHEPAIDRSVLETLPAGCRHLLYCQVRAGMEVYAAVPELRGAEVEDLYTAGAAWLEGEELRR